MKEHYEKVKEFMLRAQQECPLILKFPNKTVQDLRINLHSEEAIRELAIAFDERCFELLIDSIADSLVVIFGTAIASGFIYEDVEKALAEAMRSNMTKFIDGKLREDGKWEKGPSYTPANFKQIIDYAKQQR